MLCKNMSKSVKKLLGATLAILLVALDIMRMLWNPAPAHITLLLFSRTARKATFFLSPP